MGVPTRTAELFLFAVYVTFSVPIVYADITRFRVPDRFSLGGLACALLFRAVIIPASLSHAVVGTMLVPAVFALAAAVTNGGLGFGDVKLAAFLAAALGPGRAATAVFAASIVCVVFFVLDKCARRERASRFLPFAPFITLGAIGAYGAACAGWIA